MGEFRVKIEKLAESHLKKHFKAGNQGSIKKITQILDELAELLMKVLESRKH